MRCTVPCLVVFMTCVCASINAWDIPLAKKLPSYVLSPRNGSHVQPKEGESYAFNLQPKTGTKQSPLDCGTHSLSPGSTEIIMSPNYPKKYPTNYMCNWIFEPPAGSTLSLECQDFNVRPSRFCRRSYLLITDGGAINTRFCGRDPIYVDGIEDNLDITFKTFRRGRAKGFRCEITATSSSTSSSVSPNTSSDSSASTTGEEDTTAEPTSEGDCTCGVRNAASRIVGGIKTTINEYPWQVALVSLNGNRPFCGGSVISNRHILTAAHCVNSATPRSAAVVIGEHDWSSTTETSVRKKLRISQATRHESYSSRTLNNDIAVLELTEDIVFPSNNKIAPVCLPSSPGNLYGAVDATITGWGTLSSGGSQPKELYEVTVPTMTNAQCKATSYDSDEITNNMICAGVSAGGKDSCQGDSGGPMVTSGASGSYMEQIGIVSWGYGCADRRYPGVYTRVGNYISWINGKIGGSTTCSPPA